MSGIFRLECGVNHYDWGKKGPTSTVAQLSSINPDQLDPNKPYSELWMGAHPSLPSRHFSSKIPLPQIIRQNPRLLGHDIYRHFNGTLPFLFKVLSIAKPLSIQAHPNRQLAESLHIAQPENYPDQNHKPEIVIALTPFKGLCGFRSLSEINHFLHTVPPLHDLINRPDIVSQFEAIANSPPSHPPDASCEESALRNLFTALMSVPPERVAEKADALISFVQSHSIIVPTTDEHYPDPDTPCEDLSPILLDLNVYFPRDVGLFVFFLLNFIRLSPGEAMFLRADEIHAYIEGDVIECMAASDNVVRAGFTSKHKDVPTLTSMLNYTAQSIPQLVTHYALYPYCTLNSQAYTSSSSVKLYDPPAEEFSILRIQLNTDRAKASLEGLSGPSILICISGQASLFTTSVVEFTPDSSHSIPTDTDKPLVVNGTSSDRTNNHTPSSTDTPKNISVLLDPGCVYFVVANTPIVIEASPLLDDKPFLAFIAYCELRSHDDDEDNHSSTCNSSLPLCS